MKNKIAIVTGANRGMGRAASEKLASLGHHVIMVGKNKEQLENETTKLINKKLSVEPFILDVKDKTKTLELIKYVGAKYGQLDILLNNAGIYIEENSSERLNPNSNVMNETYEVNTMAPYRLMKGFLPLMLKNKFGRIVNVSSGLGTFAGCSLNCPSYCVSKVSLNMLTKLFAMETDGTDVKINSICPGWVQTDMGGKNAPRTIEEGVAGMIWAATLDSSGPNGGFFRDGKVVDW